MPEQQSLAIEPAAAPTPAPGAVPAGALAEGETAPKIAEQAPAAPLGGEKKPVTEQAPEKRGQSRYERRLASAYRKIGEAQARSEFFEKELTALKQHGSPQQDPGTPRLEDFRDIEEYTAATSKFASEKAVKEYQAKQQSETQKQHQARLIETWESKATRAEEKYEDFDEKVGDLRPTNPLMHAIMEADNGEDIAYYLATNMKEASRIAGLASLAQVREIGKLEAKLAAEPPKPKTPSKAPAPITPVSGVAPTTTDVPSEQDDIGPWLKKRSKQVHGKR